DVVDEHRRGLRPDGADEGVQQPVLQRHLDEDQEHQQGDGAHEQPEAHLASADLPEGEEHAGWAPGRGGRARRWRARSAGDGRREEVRTEPVRGCARARTFGERDDVRHPGEVERATAATVLPPLLDAYRAAADPDAAEDMARYMKGHARFFGITSVPRRAIDRTIVAGLAPPTEAEVADLVRACWDEEQREVQYFACDWSRKHIGRCGTSYLGVLEEAITARSWWDTVDALAGSVDRLVFAHRELRAEMDRWLASDELWLRRVALIHQLRWKEEADVDWIEAACLDR
ncbi:hypothetical protein B7486_64605, partial [cyanobacterium TDX16]